VSGFLSVYAPTVLVYLGVNALACWGLNLQYGVTGIYNLGFIVFQSAGAYTAAVLTLGPDTRNGGFQTYVFGSSLPFPLPLLLAGLVGGVLSVVVGLVVLRRLRGVVEGIVLLVLSVTATVIVTNAQGFLNGAAGLALIPQPLASVAAPYSTTYNWFFVGLVAVVCLVGYIVLVRPITSSPIGRVLRGIRERDDVIEALGRNVMSYRLFAFVMGGVLAGISGALFAQYITAWSPAGWQFVETFVFLTAIVVGGTGNDGGVLLGVVLVPVLFNEATRFLPTFGYPSLVDALEWFTIGLLALVFLWFRPQGIIPERRRRLGREWARRHGIAATAGAIPTETRAGAVQR
jgi:ABC-type branched-subunit amino acid transport system permease subunit